MRNLFLCTLLCLAFPSCGPGLDVDPNLVVPASSASCTAQVLDSCWMNLTSLVGYFKFEESTISSATVLSESSGQNLSALVVGLVNEKSTNAKVGRGLSIATSDYVNVSDNSILRYSVGDSITLTAWVNPSSLNLGGNTLFAKGQNNGSAETQYRFRIGDSGTSNKLDFSFFDGTTWHVATTAALVPLSTWSHVAVTYQYSAASTLKFYFNGAEVAWNLISGTFLVGPVVTSQPLRLGARENSGADQFFNGVLDEMTIWRRILTPAEIAALYNRQR